MVYIEEPDLTNAYTKSLKQAVGEDPLFGLRSLERFTFKDGKTIQEWIQNRVDELFFGEYYKRLTRNDWLNKAFRALRRV